MSLWSLCARQGNSEHQPFSECLCVCVCVEGALISWLSLRWVTCVCGLLCAVSISNSPVVHLPLPLQVRGAVPPTHKSAHGQVVS